MFFTVRSQTVPVLAAKNQTHVRVNATGRVFAIALHHLALLVPVVRTMVPSPQVVAHAISERFATRRMYPKNARNVIAIAIMTVSIARSATLQVCVCQTPHALTVMVRYVLKPLVVAANQVRSVTSQLLTKTVELAAMAQG
jgi:hypothetical protein